MKTIRYVFLLSNNYSCFQNTQSRVTNTRTYWICANLMIIYIIFKIPFHIGNQWIMKLCKNYFINAKIFALFPVWSHEISWWICSFKGSLTNAQFKELYWHFPHYIFKLLLWDKGARLFHIGAIHIRFCTIFFLLYLWLVPN